MFYYNTVKNLTVEQFEESLGDNFFWLESVKELGSFATFEGAVEYVIDKLYTEELIEEYGCPDYADDEGLDIDFATNSYYIKQFTILASHELFDKVMSDKGLLKPHSFALKHYVENYSHKLHFSPDYTSGTYVAIINGKIIETADDLNEELEKLAYDVEHLAEHYVLPKAELEAG